MYNGSSTCAVLWEVNPGCTHSKTRSSSIFIGKPLAAAVVPYCGHRLPDPPRDVADFQVETSVPSLAEKVSLCTLGENKWFRVRLGLEGYELPRRILGCQTSHGAVLDKAELGRERFVQFLSWCPGGIPWHLVPTFKRCRKMPVLPKSSSNLLFLLLISSRGSYPDKSSLLISIACPKPCTPSIMPLPSLE